jgi:hypothetical protein
MTDEQKKAYNDKEREQWAKMNKKIAKSSRGRELRKSNKKIVATIIKSPQPHKRQKSEPRAKHNLVRAKELAKIRVRAASENFELKNFVDADVMSSAMSFDIVKNCHATYACSLGRSDPRQWKRVSVKEINKSEHLSRWLCDNAYSTSKSRKIFEEEYDGKICLLSGMFIGLWIGENNFLNQVGSQAAYAGGLNKEVWLTHDVPLIIDKIFNSTITPFIGRARLTNDGGKESDLSLRT